MWLDPLPPSRFAAWAARSRRGFVEQQIRSAALPEAEAEAYAAQQQALLLPAGLSTPGHHVWVVRAGPDSVGYLWVQIRRADRGREAYVYDVELDRSARGRGLGRATMLAGEHAVRGLGATRVRLNVFGHNAVAIRLYDSLGYAVLVTTLTRHLDDAGPAPYGDQRSVTTRHPAQVSPGHDVWSVHQDEDEVGSVCLHEVERSDGRHAQGHDVTVRSPGYAGAVVAGIVRLCVDRGAASLALSVKGDRELVDRCREAGFGVTAQLREKELRAQPAQQGDVRETGARGR